MGSCLLCKAESRLISQGMGVCLSCLRVRPQEALSVALDRHAATRQALGLPGRPPRAEGGVRCRLCSQGCSIGEGERGFCGLRRVEQGRLTHIAGTPRRGWLHWYRDPLPTNCVADWVCPGHTAYGRHNLAVFYASCTLDCLFCQNSQFRYTDPRRERDGSVEALSAAALAALATESTFCVCFFGGDPASQMPHALAAGRRLADRGVRVCWETAGTMNERALIQALALTIESSGSFKFDLKAFDPALHQALTGGSNQQALKNFALAVERAADRSEIHTLVASTPLVPGYIDGEEVHRIAGFIASHNPEIPYALLAFYPHDRMRDLPRTPRRLAEEALEAAHTAGLANVRVGNVHLLTND